MLIQSESREETITTSATTVSSQSAKGGTKTKKKKIEGVAGNDASPNLTPRTKKTKKSKKNELEKENISVVSEGIVSPSNFSHHHSMFLVRYIYRVLIRFVEHVWKLDRFQRKAENLIQTILVRKNKLITDELKKCM